LYSPVYPQYIELFTMSRGTAGDYCINEQLQIDHDVN